jgi:NitT/TauT family transport system substrate-binding protein
MKNTVGIPALIIISCLILFGCDKPQPPKAPDEVKLQLKWHHQAQFAGFYMAQEKGYYAAENIKVTFLEGGLDVDIAETVSSGKADFGVMTPEYILINRSRGADLSALAAIYRRSAVVYAAKADSGIVKPADFMGKTVAVEGKGGSLEFYLLFRALMRNLKIDISKLNIIPYDPEYTAFYSGKADVTAAYYTGGIIRIRKKGMKLNLIWPGDYGVNFYSDTIVATDRLLSENPDLVARFLRATLKGWHDAVENYKDAVTITLKYARDKDSDTQTAMMEAMLPLVHTGEDRIGWMKPDVWREMYDTLSEQKLLNKSFDVNQAYTMRFIEAIQGEKFR